MSRQKITDPLPGLEDALEEPQGLAFADLEGDIREKVLSRFREQRFDDWYEGIYDDFVDDISSKGLAVNVDTRTFTKRDGTTGTSTTPRIYFDLYRGWAGFDADVDNLILFITAYEIPIPKVMSLLIGLSNPVDKQTWDHPLRQFNSACDIAVKGESGRAQASLDACTQWVEDQLNDQEAQEVLTAVGFTGVEDPEYQRFKNVCEAILTDTAPNTLYRRLREEDKYLDSDEYIIEGIEANGDRFTEDGEIWE